MPHADLRSFLAALEKAGQLVRVAEAVRPEPDLSAAAYAAANMPHGPAVLFEHVVGYRQPVLLNAHGSWANMAIALDLPPTTLVAGLLEALEERWHRYPREPVVVPDGPVKSVRHTRDINLFHLLPLFRINPGDGGCYLSKATIFSADPRRPADRNAAIYRLQVKGPDLIGLHVGTAHDIATHLRHAEEDDRPLDVALAIGTDPIVPFVGSAALRYVEDEVAMMGALRGAPMEMVRGETVDLLVPATAEIVIEGRIRPNVRVIEGPFGEFTGHYSHPMRELLIDVTAVTHRPDPIFENLYLGKPFNEIDYILGLNTSLVFTQQLKADFPEVIAVNAMHTHGQLTIISLRPRFPGTAKAVAARLLSLPHGLSMTKTVVLVDDDVDPFDIPQVFWSLNTRFRADDDLVLLPNMSTSRLDPSADPRGIVTKMILDATRPAFPKPGMPEARVVQAPAGWQAWRERLEKLRG